MELLDDCLLSGWGCAAESGLLEALDAAGVRLDCPGAAAPAADTPEPAP